MSFFICYLVHALSARYYYAETVSIITCCLYKDFDTFVCIHFDSCVSFIIICCFLTDILTWVILISVI